MEEIKKEDLENWMQKEQEELKDNAFDGERLPPLKLVEKEITRITVDFSKPFDKWVDQEKGTVKKLVPVEHNGEKKIWWLNVKNPIYSEVIDAGLLGQTELDILQSGFGEKTRYTLVKKPK